jgi:hypothetical protein
MQAGKWMNVLTGISKGCALGVYGDYRPRPKPLNGWFWFSSVDLTSLPFDRIS